jgi:hypothetical protein
MSQEASAHNPYSAPKAKLEAFADQGTAVWRDGKILVCRRDAAFPGRCIKCNEPAREAPARFKLTWHHAGWYVLVLINVLLYAIVSLIVRKRATLEVGLCEAHLRKRMLSRWIGWGGFAVLVRCFVVGTAFQAGWLIAVAGLAIIPWALAGVLLSPQIRAARIDKELLRVRGCGRDFLDTLPEFVD